MRDRARITPLFTAFAPDIVIHAAALKHVPYLEADWSEGIKTNIFGSVNVTDAAIAAGAKIFVLISTDKAIEPVSMLGATKRFAEMYAQSRDAEFVAAAAGMRLVAVRFGNVLGSVGSVVPKFKAQIERGGPVTVTSPDMIRYFMTIREACDLVLTAASHARTDVPEAERAAVYILKMGQPVKIMDLAERMIRLAGFEPGVDIEIVVTGVRPGERLNEILFAQRRAQGRDRSRRRHGGQADLRRPDPDAGLARPAGGRASRPMTGGGRGRARRGDPRFQRAGSRTKPRQRLLRRHRRPPACPEQSVGRRDQAAAQLVEGVAACRPGAARQPQPARRHRRSGRARGPGPARSAATISGDADRLGIGDDVAAPRRAGRRQREQDRRRQRFSTASSERGAVSPPSGSGSGSRASRISAAILALTPGAVDQHRPQATQSRSRCASPCSAASFERP